MGNSKMPALFILCIVSLTTMAQHKYTNALIKESSPYLLQHAHNPVDWRPWNEESLQAAKDENKLIIVSIGYAACHWCHVMEHESFEDTTVARIMNENFICIKVDREERPDIDQIYMDACQIIRGNGGWPLNAFALPDGRPVEAMTYQPRDNWINILEFFASYYPENIEEAENRADLISEGVKQLEIVPDMNDSVSEIPSSITQIALDSWKDLFDLKNGGRKGAPKFPMPAGIDWQLQLGSMSGLDEAEMQAYLTLDKMMEGGIYDFLGGGFARYSVDAFWFAPHFEKMLYDNAQLITSYSIAFQKTGNSRYREVVEETIEFCNRELRDETGMYYSSLDADSEGEEGKFYVWSIEEIENTLEDASIFKKLFNIKYNGNWEDGKNILARAYTDAEAMSSFGLTQSGLDELLNISREKLFKERKGRIRPGLDDKALVSWNGLMISGLTSAYKAIGNDQFLQDAIQTASAIQTNCIKDDFRLDRNYKAGQSAINAYLDDYANLIYGLIDLYECTFNEDWLNLAVGLNNHVLNHFSDESSPYLFYTSDLDPALASRKRELSDNVIPASNSMMAHNLYRLGHLTYNTDWIGQSKSMVIGMLEQIEKYPSFYSKWGQLAELMANNYFEVAIVGPDALKLSKQFQKSYQPGALFLGSVKAESELHLLQNKYLEGETMIYVCVDKQCTMPVKTVQEAIEQMRSFAP